VAEPVRGFAELDRALAELPHAVQVSVLGVAVARGADIIRHGAGNRAPVGKGDLAGLMTYEMEAIRDGITAHIGPAKETFYGLFQEFGTSRHAAQPFLRPAIDEDGSRAVQVLAVELGRGIEREAKRLAPAIR
jgi:HK97 gp10 family phage protein